MDIIKSFKEYKDIMDPQTDSLGKIYAGEVHYSRIPVEYWEHRILMIKALKNMLYCSQFAMYFNHFFLGCEFSKYWKTLIFKENIQGKKEKISSSRC